MTDQRALNLKATQQWAAAFAAPMPDGMQALLALAAEDVRFVDPFNDVTGKLALSTILNDMTERCIDPTFDVLDVSASDRAGYIRWRFTFKPKNRPEGAPWTFNGMTELTIGADGKIVAHADHWDSASQLFAKLPLLGWPMRRALKALTVTPPPR